MKIYLASSWRNKEYPRVLDMLRTEGHEVYDFRSGQAAFGWQAIDPEWERWSSHQFREALKHPLSEAGFAADMGALRSCDACVLLLPCNRSAHLEAGWAKGAGKSVVVLTDSLERPELMYLMLDEVCVEERELVVALSKLEMYGARPDPDAASLDRCEARARVLLEEEEAETARAERDEARTTAELHRVALAAAQAREVALRQALLDVRARHDCADCRAWHYFDRGAVGGKQHVPERHHPRCPVWRALAQPADDAALREFGLRVARYAHALAGDGATARGGSVAGGSLSPSLTAAPEGAAPVCATCGKTLVRGPIGGGHFDYLECCRGGT